MIEKVGVCWYHVKRCGYYPLRGGDNKLFGSFEDTLQDLRRWANGKQLVETSILPTAREAGGDEADRAAEENLPIYLFDMVGRDDDWLFVLWNQIPATEGRVASVSGRAQVGSAAVVANQLAAGTIPGFATYFYAVPSLNLVAGVKFQHRTYGHEPMRSYLGSFLRSQARAVVRDAADETQIIGYTARRGGELVQALAQFRSETLRQGGERAMLIRRAREIRRVVRRSVLVNGRQPDVAMFQQLIRHLTGAPNVPAWQETPLQYEIPLRLEPDDVRRMLDAWDNSDASDDWEDLGFRLTRESNIRWASKSTARTTLELDVDRTDIERVEPRELLRELRRNRERLLSVIQDR
jgi:hypothetical protein